MYLSDLFEYNTKDTYNREAFDQIMPYIMKLMQDGKRFTYAFDQASAKFGPSHTTPLFMNLQDALEEKGFIIEGQFIFEGYDKGDAVRVKTDQVTGFGKIVDIKSMFVQPVYTVEFDDGGWIEIHGDDDAKKQMMILQKGKHSYERSGQIHDFFNEHMAWGRQGNKIIRKYRCTIGPRKNRAVNKPGDCFKAPDIKKRIALRKTKAKLGSRMARKRKKTMRSNPISKRVQSLNKPNKRKKKPAR